METFGEKQVQGFLTGHGLETKIHSFTESTENAFLAAQALGVKSETLSELLNGHIDMSPEMAIRLSLAFDTTAESWMNQQTQYDLWQAKQRMNNPRVRKLFTAEPAELS